MMQVAVCDDQPLYTKKIENVIKNNDFGIEIEVDCFNSGTELLKSIEEKEYDIVIMDIELSKSDQEDNGMNTAEKIKEKYPDILVIFVSGYSDYFKDLVQFEPFRFVDKGYLEDLLYKALQKAIYRKLRYTCTFKNKYRINLNEVIYIYSRSRSVFFHFTDGHEESFNYILDDIEDEISKFQTNYIRVSKSYLVNMIHARNVGNDDVTMKNGDVIKVTYNYKKKAIPIITKFLYM